MKNFIFVFICLLLAVPSQARIIFVDANTPDSNDGSSWAKAYKYLQDALADANSTGDVNEIRVAQGIYTPDSNSADPNGSGDRYATFQLINSVAIKGGFAGFSQPDPNARDIEIYGTILSGDLNGDDGPDFANNDENSYHVVTGSGTNTSAVLDGFTITGGNANEDYSSPHANGGGMFNESSSPTINNCTFSGNSADDWGGGMGNRENSSPTLTNCTFSGNSAEEGGGMGNRENSSPTVTNCTFRGNKSYYSGGGMHNYESNSPTITNCTFSGNSAQVGAGGGMRNYDSDTTVTNCAFSGNYADYCGGGMSNLDCNPMVANCTFIGNTVAEWDGGGMYNYYSSPTVINCTFRDNTASMFGGGMYNWYNSPTVNNCTFIGNTAYLGGGISNEDCLSSATVANCTFSGNTAYHGGGMSNNYSNHTVTNCTFYGNSALEEGGGMRNWYSPTMITNCILWGDAPNEIYVFSRTPVITYSNVQGGWEGEGNIDANPCFIDPGYWVDANDPNIIVEPNDPNAVWVDGDYHLLPASPCIDAGNDANVYTDIEGNVRPFDFPGVDNNGELPEFDMGAYELTPIEAQMKFTPPNLNCKSKGKFVKAHITLPEGFTPEDVALDTPALAYPMNLESEYLEVFLNDNGSVELEITFDRQSFCDVLTETGQAEVTVIGSLATGQYFYATDIITVRP